eukprot:TRINITY_DN18791_c0_g1_i1.p1 TRINITY_DN18791_c0_g1~~TRINITY_DN18791_c0_g1_i1.p1  ORF type:complete len:541 (-),score=106.62 TRINITY_DN18791_c0_g1_i1:34-1656(-)
MSGLAREDLTARQRYLDPSTLTDSQIQWSSASLPVPPGAGTYVMAARPVPAGTIPQKPVRSASPLVAPRDTPISWSTASLPVPSGVGFCGMAARPVPRGTILQKPARSVSPLAAPIDTSISWSSASLPVPSGHGEAPHSTNPASDSVPALAGPARRSPRPRSQSARVAAELAKLQERISAVEERFDRDVRSLVNEAASQRWTALEELLAKERQAARREDEEILEQRLEAFNETARQRVQTVTEAIGTELNELEKKVALISDRTSTASAEEQGDEGEAGEAEVAGERKARQNLENLALAAPGQHDESVLEQLAEERLARGALEQAVLSYLADERSARKDHEHFVNERLAQEKALRERLEVLATSAANAVSLRTTGDSVQSLDECSKNLLLEAQIDTVKAALADLQHRTSRIEVSTASGHSAELPPDTESRIMNFVEMQASEARAAVKNLTKEVPEELRRIVGSVMEDHITSTAATFEKVWEEMGKLQHITGKQEESKLCSISETPQALSGSTPRRPGNIPRQTPAAKPKDTLMFPAAPEDS